MEKQEQKYTYRIVPDDAEVLLLEAQQQDLLNRTAKTVWFDPILATRVAAKKEDTWGVRFDVLVL